MTRISEDAISIIGIRVTNGQNLRKLRKFFRSQVVLVIKRGDAEIRREKKKLTFCGWLTPISLSPI